jgi:hypothetical protein
MLVLAPEPTEAVFASSAIRQRFLTVHYRVKTTAESQRNTGLEVECVIHDMRSSKAGRTKLTGKAMQSKTHWEHVYTAKSSTEVSWYQPHATLSLGLIQRIGIGPDAAIIDVGGGASTLTDDLVAHGYHNLSVLDLSGEALAVARRRLGQKSELVQWIEADVTSAPALS